MKKIISDEFGFQIIEREGKFLIRYDKGHFAIEIVESEITKEEAEKAARSEKDTHEVILKTQHREKQN